MKITKTILLFFIAILLTTACGSILGEEEGDRPERLNVKDWPTPQVAAATGTPTPFPITTLPATADANVAEVSPTATPDNPQLVTGSANLPDSVTSLLSTLNTDDTSGSDFVDQIRSLRGVPALPPGIAPVAVGVLVADQATIRQGPGESYGQIQVVTKGELAGILGKNEDRSWVYVITIQKVLGWLPVETLRMTSGNLEAEPVLPPNPLASFLSQAGSQAAAPAAAPAASSAGSGATSNPATTTTAQAIDPTSLAPVTTARVTTPVNMRQRPGPDFKKIEVAAEDEEVSILARNQDNQWALIKMTNGTIGWVSADYLDIDGALTDAPEVRTLDADPASSTVAPVVSASNTATSAQTSSSGSTAAQSVVSATQSSDSTSLPVKAFAPVASARVVEKTDGRRGPGESFGPEIELTADMAVDILARNEDSSWVVVRNPLGGVGWTPFDNLKDVEGFIENAAPVTTAWVESNETSLMSGPGIFYNEVGKLAIHSPVAVLGINDNRSWAFIEALNGGRGWVQLRLIKLAGSYADIPEYKAPALAEGNPADAGLPAPSADSATTGKMVFQTSSGGEIKLINADGTGLHTLTHGIDPVLSPDGQQVAFTRWTGDIGELWVINVDGSNEHQILGEMHKAKGPAWSPDGSQIILNFQQGGRLEEKKLCQPLDTSPHPPRNAGDIRVGVSDQGEVRLCWTEPPDPHWTLRTINVADGSFEDLYGGLYAFRPAWDPDQPERIVSDAGNGLLSVNINASETSQQLTDVIGDSSPVFSPDGRYIAVTSRLQGEYSIFRMNSDGGGRVRLTQTPLWVPVQADSDGELWNDVSPTWSPDGSLIAFLTDRNGPWEIWLMNADGSNQRPMFSDEINDALNITYEFVDEHAISWR
ncbi:MAG: SH3 domain-containing protein [Anaerolineae bacterium]|nr:SH3 domain-containing protein [Anaerolineae bacterium]